jgi:hypothetical protein
MAYTFSPYMDSAVDPFATGETEEERRRRLEAEAAAAAPAPVAPTPVKQTITYDPVTGEQRMKIEGSVADLSAANTLTPTVQAPGEMGRGMPAPVAPAAPAEMAAPAPVAERQLPPGVQMVDGKLQLAPVGEGVQLAGPMVAGAIKNQPEPVVTAAQLGSQQFPMTPAPAVAASPAPPAPEVAPEAATAFNPNTFQDRFVAAAANKDTTDLHNLYQTTQDPVQKQIAGVALRDQLSKQVGEEKGRQELAGMNENDIARLLKSKTEEGSYAKMLLLGFISPDLAGKEAAKLGLNDKWAVGQDASGRALIYKTRDGVPVEGYDSTTGARMSATDLITAVGSGQRKLDIVGGTYVNDKTGEVGRVVTDQKTGISYIQTDSGRQPMSGFRPQASGGTLDMQRVAQVQKQNIDLAGDWAKTQMRVQSAGPEAANKYLGEFNAKYGTNYTLNQLSGGPPQIDMNTGQIIGPVARPTTAAGPVAPAAVAVPQVDAAAVARAQGDLASLDREIKRLPPNDSRLETLQQERAKAVQRIQSAGGAVSPADIESATKVKTAVAESAGKAPIEVNTDEQKLFNKAKETINNSGSTGREIADITRNQVNRLMSSPEIIGYLNGDDTRSAQFGKLIREVATGSYSGGDDAAQGKELADAMVRANMPMSLQGTLQEIRQANTKINALTLRSNEGPGAISNFENKQNQNNNMTNIGDLTAWSALTGLTRRQFVGDISQAKATFLQQHPELKTDTQFNAAWDKSLANATKAYDAIYQARLLAVKPYYDAANKSATNATAQKAYKDAAVAAFRSYPVPEFNLSTGKWEYKTKQARDAAMAAIAGGI